MIDINLIKSLFPNSYLCCLSKSGILYETKLTPETTPKIPRFSPENIKDEVGVYFTPNSIKTEFKRHALTNLEKIQAFYIDLDIEGAKIITDEVSKEKRRIGKERYLGRIYELEQLNLLPTLIIENRNGYHLYWSVLGECTIEEFKKVEDRLVEYFRDFGADTSTTKPVTLLRVPGSINHKGGEAFEVLVIGLRNNKYTPGDFLPLPLPPKTESETTKIYRRPKLLKAGVNEERSKLFDQVHDMRIEDVLLKLSGLPAVAGEQFVLHAVHSGRRYNIDIDGKPTANFINTEQNHIYGKRGSEYNGPTITQWLRYYGNSYKDIANLYKSLFNL